MAPKDVEKTTFRTPIENFYYAVMPFKLKNAGAIFRDMMYHKMEDYVDDIVVKSRKLKDHVKILRKVLKQCRLFKLRMNPLK